MPLRSTRCCNRQQPRVKQPGSCSRPTAGHLPRANSRAALGPGRPHSKHAPLSTPVQRQLDALEACPACFPSCALMPVYSASRSPSARSSRRMVPSMQAASTQLWSWLTAAGRSGGAAHGHSPARLVWASSRQLGGCRRRCTLPGGTLHVRQRSHAVSHKRRRRRACAPWTHVTEWCRSSVKRRPMRTSKRRTLPSTLPARISALRQAMARLAGERRHIKRRRSGRRAGQGQKEQASPGTSQARRAACRREAARPSPPRTAGSPPLRSRCPGSCAASAPGRWTASGSPTP